MNLQSKKKILIVAESINVEDSSGSKANVALIQNLKDAGFELLVYHYTRKEIQLPGISCVSIKEKKWNFLYLLSRLQRKLQHGFKLNLAKYLEPVFGFSFTFFNDTNSIAKALKTIDDIDPDLVLTLSKGASFRPHYALLKVPELHSKWMAYIHDPYPFHYYPEPYDWSEPGYQQKIEFFQEVSQKCRWAGYPSLLLKEWMERHFPFFKDKGVVIPHQLRRENSAIQELPDYFNPEKLTLLHAGSLLKQRPPQSLILAFQKFLQKNPDAKEHARLLFLGGNSYHLEELQKFQKEIPQLFITGYVPYEEVRFLQQQASVNIILEAKAEVSPFLPGKFPHCVAADKPILLLGPARSESRRLLGNDYPYWSELDDVEKIVLILDQLYRDWKENPKDIRLNRPDLMNYLSVENLKTTMENLSL